MSKRNMVFVNPTAIAIFASLLCAAMCNGKTMYDDWENGPSGEYFLPISPSLCDVSASWNCAWENCIRFILNDAHEPHVCSKWWQLSNSNCHRHNGIHSFLSHRILIQNVDGWVDEWTAFPCKWIQKMHLCCYLKHFYLANDNNSLSLFCSLFLAIRHHLDITEMKRPAFYAGSRYGRSQYGGSLGSSTNVRVAPRRDFHFLRYGKRTTEPIFDVNASPTIQCYENVRDYILTCSFTGVQDYYRCWKG